MDPQRYTTDMEKGRILGMHQSGMSLRDIAASVSKSVVSRMDLSDAIDALKSIPVAWRKTSAEGLDLDYAILFPKRLADQLFDELQQTLEYYEGDASKVKIFGKWHDIPRQQVAHGEPGMVYKFSGTKVPAKNWTPTLEAIKNLLSKLAGIEFNFVLINRYRSGADHIGEHRDGESELDPNAPIASISLGQHRDFVLKHGDVRKKGTEKRNVPLVKMSLEHGSLLLMNPPTNKYWYHSLPPRKNAPGVRINLTFRRIIK